MAPENQGVLDPYHVLSLLPLRPYESLADIGCGSGYFTVDLGKYLSRGKLYAMDIQEEMVQACRDRVQQAHLSNVEVLRCREISFPVSPASLDCAFLAFVLHETEDRQSFLAAVAKLLRPGAWCAVLEWYRQKMDEGPPFAYRVTSKQVRQFAAGVGLTYKWQRDLNDKQYMVMLTKK